MNDTFNPNSMAIVKVPDREFKGKIPSQYWGEVMVLRDNGLSTRRIASTLNERHQQSFTFSQVISLLHFLNQEKRQSIESDFLNEVKVSSDMQRVENLTVKMEHIMTEAELIKDRTTVFKATDRLIKLYEMKMKLIGDVVTSNPKNKEPTPEDKERLLAHLMKKLNLERQP